MTTVEELVKDPKIDEALQLLNNSAKEKRDEIDRLISEKYSNIKASLSETRNVMQRNPWVFLGGVASGFLLLGYFLGTTVRQR